MLKILAVEDEASILSSIVDILELDNYEVLTASNGLEGLEILKVEQPDLIISDVMMPQMDGHEFFKVVKEESKTAIIPFMFLTALSTYNDIREGMNLGADDYIIKPFDYATLSNAVRTRLTKQHTSKLLQQHQFTRRLIDFQENERHRVSQEINAMIYEPISALNLLLNVKSDSESTLENIKELSTTLISNLQNLDEWLQPSMISQLSLYPVLFWLIEQYRVKYKLYIDVQRSGRPPIYNNVEKVIVYRLVDEVLTNIVNHANAHNVSIRLSTKDNFLEILIEDDGVGFNLDLALQGHTMGLHMLSERIALLNGQINIHSIPGSGTTINLAIPYYDVDQTRDSIIEKKQSSIQKKSLITVYLVDQQDIIRQGLTQILSHDNTIEIVGEAESGQIALKQIQSLFPDVIILDMALDDQSSFDFIQLIKQHRPEVKVLCFATHDQVIYVVEALRHGGDGYVLKSSSAIEILNGLHAVAEGKQYICHVLSDELLEWTLNTQDKQVKSDYDMLTERERTIMLYVIDGSTSSEIGEKLSISPRTVEKHRSNLMKKLNLKTPSQLLRYAIEHGIVSH